VFTVGNYFSGHLYTINFIYNQGAFMASSSKTKSRVESKKPPVDILRDRVSDLGNTLNGLMEAISKASDEIKALQPLLEVASKVWAETDKKPVITTEPVKKVSKEQETLTGTISAEAFLEAINTLSIPELINKLKKANAKQNVIRNIINERKKLRFHLFESLDDLITRIKGLAWASLDKIMSEWS